ncbi:Hypothetical predicted protein [Lecanosticta acicola]|uniref:Heterokaryon incompatibility domain-containing protein n=1 Tax=Lecanosticta acicola TaxID=111012 RepID=A0AAI8Z8J9_9PEZI|nr:Hypothetical predicted protein [Lecanosticta acicola]
MASADELHDSLYEPLPGARHIRILTLESASTRADPIICRIQSENYYSAEYAALSYSWGMSDDGDATLNRSILMNGRVKAVTQNLFEGLSRIRSHQVKPLRLWIDAVCINQADIDERNSQVAQMADIYRNAAIVLVWLGEGRSEAEDSSMLTIMERLLGHKWRVDHLACISCISHCLLDVQMSDCGCRRQSTKQDLLTKADKCHELDRMSDLRPWLEGYVNTSEANANVATQRSAAVIAFYSRRYWSRRWVLQELYHAKTTIWYWGPCKCKFYLNSWIRLLGLLVRILSNLLDLRPGDKEVTHISNAAIHSADDFKRRANLLMCLANIAQGRLNDLPAVMALCVSFECGDARDRLFAIASMCKGEILPDYRFSVAQTSVYFTRILLENGDFYVWQGNLNSTLLSRQGTEDEHLPSWAIDVRKTFVHYSNSAGFSSGKSLSVLDLTDSVLTCCVNCYGVVRGINLEEGSFTLAYEQDFPTRSAGSDTSSRPTQWHCDRFGSTELQELKLGDILLALVDDSEKSYLTGLSLFVLRAVPAPEVTYRIICVLDGDDYVLENQEGHSIADGKVCNSGAYRELHDFPLDLKPSIEEEIIRHGHGGSTSSYDLDEVEGDMYWEARKSMQWAHNNHLIPIVRMTVRIC